VEGEDFAVGAANARIEGTALVLTFIAVRETHQRRGIGGALLEYMISEGQRRGLHRFVGEDSIGILEVESDMEMTAEWPLPVAGKGPQ
jgi:ribosomal protein S18 acetylase RimI-like enzyme